MPLPAPLAKSASKKRKKSVMAKTMADLKAGPHHKDRTHKQEVAIGLKQSGQSNKPPAGKKMPMGKKGPAAMAMAKMKMHKDANRKPRNKGRH